MRTFLARGRKLAACGLVAALAGGFLLGSLPTVAGDDPAAKKEPDVKTGAKPPADPFPGEKPKAPPLEGGLGWINTAGPIEIGKLKGKVVLLDFWTYCCINCMHILPDLAKLEEEFPNELVVIGVHSAKFEGERDTENIKDAVLRYGIKHPVVNDGRMAIWRSYGVRAWPTQVLIDPEGNVVGGLSGEGHYEDFRRAINKLIDFHQAKGTLDRTPLRFELAQYGTERTPLRFPGKVHADPRSGRLFVADSSQNRVVVAGLADGKVQAVIGDGTAGLQDGPFGTARFDDPQGLAADGDVLYVADRRNHVIRKVDLKARTVSTIAGTGVQGYERRRTGPAREIALASPWDLELVGTDLYIAMAGTHQIWKLDLAAGTVGAFAGNGRENIDDGARADAEFAQPSGLASDGEWLYVADSEVSAVRRVGLKDDIVDTLVGTGLFEFGDRDGVGGKARLQHALGVALANGLVYVADTYNNKLKTIDPKTKEVRSFLGDGKPGAGDDPPRFDEPGGIDAAGGKLYVADTNNHKIRVVDLSTKKTSTLELAGLEPVPAPEEAPIPASSEPMKLQPVALKPGALRFLGSVAVPTGSKLNPAAPMSYRAEARSAAGEAKLLAKGRIEPIRPEFSFTLPAPDLANAASLRVSVTSYPCETGSEGVCRVKTSVWEIPILLDANEGAREVTLPATD